MSVSMRVTSTSPSTAPTLEQLRHSRLLARCNGDDIRHITQLAADSTIKAEGQHKELKVSTGGQQTWCVHEMHCPAMGQFMT
jgi:hypothetical protein